LTFKLPVFKKFRKSLSEFIERLITSAADLGSLYTSDLMGTPQTWVIALSSSQIRRFRHTATVVALEVETALCDVAAAVEREAEVVSRQREGERKSKASNKGAAVRDKELEGKAEEVRERRTKLAEFLKEFVDGWVANPFIRCLNTHTLPIASLSIAIGILIPTFVQNVFAPSVYGLKSTPVTSSMEHTCVTLGGSSDSTHIVGCIYV